MNQSLAHRRVLCPVTKADFAVFSCSSSSCHVSDIRTKLKYCSSAFYSTFLTRGSKILQVVTFHGFKPLSGWIQYHPRYSGLFALGFCCFTGFHDRLCWQVVPGSFQHAPSLWNILHQPVCSIHPAGPAGEGEGVAAHLPPRVTSWQLRAEEDEPQVISSGASTEDHEVSLAFRVEVSWLIRFLTTL